MGVERGKRDDRDRSTYFAAVVGSAAFHAAVLLLASLMAFELAGPAVEAPSRVVMADLEPVDNRAPAEVGGGGEGDLGGVGTERTVPVRVDPTSAAARDRAAESLLAEVTPRALPADLHDEVLGALSPGVGRIAGPGRGGEGGSGGGSAGGVGKGVGPSTEFFGARETGLSFVYVIDCSGSMAKHRGLDRAGRELLSSLEQLPPDARFGVVFYNLDTTLLSDILLPATAANTERVRARLLNLRASGGTDHAKALEAAFSLHPEVVYFLTDGRQLTPEQADRLLDLAGATRVQVVEFGDGPDPGTTDPLKTIATGTGGAYRYLDLSRGE